MVAMGSVTKKNCEVKNIFGRITSWELPLHNCPNNPLGQNAKMGQKWPQGTCLTLFSCPEKEFLTLTSHKCSSWLLKDSYPA